MWNEAARFPDFSGKIIMENSPLHSPFIQSLFRIFIG
jgi:hypothetical protein